MTCKQLRNIHSFDLKISLIKIEQKFERKDKTVFKSVSSSCIIDWINRVFYQATYIAHFI